VKDKSDQDKWSKDSKTGEWSSKGNKDNVKNGKGIWTKDPKTGDWSQAAAGANELWTKDPKTGDWTDQN